MSVCAPKAQRTQSGARAAPRYLADMTLRPPRPSATPQRQDALDYEIAREQASTLGRLGRALERALAALSEFAHRAGTGEGGANEGAQTGALRAQLVQEA